MEIRRCKRCGFILGTRPNLRDDNGVCLACLNYGNKKKIDWKARQDWLTGYIAENRNPQVKWECVVGVSGGKDSCAIVKRLIEAHGVKNPLLVHVCDEFTPSEAGKHNLSNVEETRKSFIEELHPLKWIEQQLYSKPMEIAAAFGIPIVFMGENSAFEYGESEECEIFHPATTDKLKVIFMGSIWPYSNTDSLCQAKKMGFKTLDDFPDDWQRQGSADAFTQIDSKGYMIQAWTKFIKFGFQRVSDMACRLVREGVLTKDQAEQMIKDSDWICDPLAKRDFCRTIEITEEEFDRVVDRFANQELLIKDVNGHWRRKDLM